VSKFDFDKFWQEKNGEAKPKSVIIENKEWVLKAELPAEASLMALRMMNEKDKDDEVLVDEIIEVYNAIMGKDKVNELLKTGIGTQKLFGLMQYIMTEVYDMKADEEKNKIPQQAKE
jgi:hypothetical protein